MVASTRRKIVGVYRRLSICPWWCRIARAIRIGDNIDRSSLLLGFIENSDSGSDTGHYIVHDPLDLGPVFGILLEPETE
jgi:hypothetical protein